MHHTGDVFFCVNKRSWRQSSCTFPLTGNILWKERGILGNEWKLADLCKQGKWIDKKKSTWLQNNLGNASEIGPQGRNKTVRNNCYCYYCILNNLWLCFNSVFKAAVRIWCWLPMLYVECCWSSTSWLLLSICTSIEGKKIEFFKTLFMPKVLFWRYHLKTWHNNNFTTSQHFQVVLANIRSVCFSPPAKSFQEAEGKTKCFSLHNRESDRQTRDCEISPPVNTNTVNLIRGSDILSTSQSSQSLVSWTSLSFQFDCSRKSGWFTFRRVIHQYPLF